jgi:hypothetical protein
VGLTIGSAENMQWIHGELLLWDILVPHLAAYAGTTREGRLRIAVCAGRTDAMLHRLIDELRRLV